MTEDDTLTMTGFRRGVDSEITEEVGSIGMGVTVVEWWETLGWEEEGGIKDLRTSGVIGEDGVHLAEKTNMDAAVFFLHRLSEVPLQSGEGGLRKRRRLN